MGQGGAHQSPTLVPTSLDTPAAPPLPTPSHLSPPYAPPTSLASLHFSLQILVKDGVLGVGLVPGVQQHFTGGLSLQGGISDGLAAAPAPTPSKPGHRQETYMH